MSIAQSVTRTTTLIAICIALVIGLFVPAGFFAISYQYMLGSMDTEAELSARSIDSLVMSNPVMWRYEENRLQDLLHRRHHELIAETRLIRDLQGKVVAEMSEPVSPPVVTRQHDIYDAGTVVARVQISRSLAPLLMRTAIIGALSAFTGLIIFFVLRVMPLRAVRRSQHALEESEKKYRSVYNSMKEGMGLYRITYDEDRIPVSFSVLDINPAFATMLGLARDDVVGRDGGSLCGGSIMRQFSLILRAIATGESLSFQMHDPGKDRFYDVSVFSPQADTFATLIEDITDRKSSEERIQRLAYYDPLTGLPNRFLLLDRLTQALGKAARNRGKVALLFLDLDRFKIVNDTLGHEQGDQLLLQVSQRLLGTVRKGDTIARLGGDEFVVVSFVAQEGNAAHVAQNLLDRMSPPFNIGGREIYTSASVGIAIFPDDGKDAAALLRCADMAMYAAKEAGRSGFVYFSADMNRKVHERMEMETSLRSALDREDFFLAFQPIVNVAAGCVSGAEVLVRWQSTSGGQIMPNSFIPAAEESGLIVPLGEWVLRAACRKVREWQDAGIPPLRISVNVSGRQLAQANFVETVERVLSSTGASASYLEIEITESSLMAHADVAARTLSRLKELGLLIVIDDFGTGYSSLGYLKKFPIDRIKIDRSFVRDVCVNSNDRAIVEAIIAMAEKLDIHVVAEGVETPEQVRFLQERGCSDQQGFFFHRPMDEQALLRLLAGSKDIVRQAKGE